MRVTEDQYKLLQANVEGKRPAKGKGAPRSKRRREDLPENIVTRQITDFLRACGWSLQRQQVGTYIPYREFRAYLENPDFVVHPIRIGEDGMTDWRAERPIIPAGGRPRDARALEVFYIEMKAPGKKPKPEQALWIDRKNATGTTADYHDSFDGFKRWYDQRYGVRAGDPPRKPFEEKW